MLPSDGRKEEQVQRSLLREVMEEVGKEDTFRDMGEAIHGISHRIFFTQHSAQGLMELVSPGYEGDLP